jgi:hypothetical protein
MESKVASHNWTGLIQWSWTRCVLLNEITLVSKKSALHRESFLEASINVIERWPFTVGILHVRHGMFFQHRLTENVTWDRGFQYILVNVALASSFRAVASMSGKDRV